VDAYGGRGGGDGGGGEGGGGGGSSGGGAGMEAAAAEPTIIAEARTDVGFTVASKPQTANITKPRPPSP
jgi:hypothetical protein